MIQLVDVVGQLNSAGAFIVQVGQSVLLYPANLPLFIKENNVFREFDQNFIETRTDINGQYQLSIPWPSEQTPSTQKWILQLPDGSRYAGVAPDLVAGPVTLYDLIHTYAWTFFDYKVPTPPIQPIIITGPSGPPGPPGPVGPGGSSLLYPETYGVVGDGVTDDTAAFQAYLNALKALPSGIGCLSKRSGLPQNILITAPVTLDYAGTSPRARLQIWGGGSQIWSRVGPGATCWLIADTGGNNDVAVTLEQIQFFEVDINTVAAWVLRCTNLGAVELKQLAFREVHNCASFVTSGQSSVRVSQPTIQAAILPNNHHVVGFSFDGSASPFVPEGLLAEVFCPQTNVASTTDVKLVVARSADMRVTNPRDIGNIQSYPDIDANSTLEVVDDSSLGWGINAAVVPIVGTFVENGIPCILVQLSNAGVSASVLLKPLSNGKWTIVATTDDASQAAGILFLSMGGTNGRGLVIQPSNQAPITNDNVSALVVGDYVGISRTVPGAVTKVVVQGPGGVVSPNGAGYVGRVISVSGAWSSAFPLILFQPGVLPTVAIAEGAIAVGNLLVAGDVDGEVKVAPLITLPDTFTAPTPVRNIIGVALNAASDGQPVSIAKPGSRVLMKRDPNFNIGSPAGSQVFMSGFLAGSVESTGFALPAATPSGKQVGWLARDSAADSSPLDVWFEPQTAGPTFDVVDATPWLVDPARATEIYVALDFIFGGTTINLPDNSAAANYAWAGTEIRIIDWDRGAAGFPITAMAHAGDAITGSFQIVTDGGVLVLRGMFQGGWSGHLE